MPKRSFGREFNAHAAVQVLVSKAQRNRTAVCPEQLAPVLADEFPDFSAGELTRMLCAAAFDASVPILPADPASSASR